jgi:tRNA(Leu) C34 or U34 (ribose-2'-O)-methylase TrmL
VNREKYVAGTARGYAAIGLIRPKNLHNEGGVMRAAMCFGAQLVMFQGARFQRQPSNVTRAEKHIPTLHVDNICDTTPYNCQKVAVDLRDFTHPERAMYIFGPEDGTLGKEVHERCQHVVSIPTAFCLNLAATVNVVLYDRMLKRGRLGDRLAA